MGQKVRAPVTAERVIHLDDVRDVPIPADVPLTDPAEHT
jgi:hypothetical protein